MKLIDADELIIDLGFTWDDIVPTHDEFVALIRRQPTIDPDSLVKRGRWIAKNPRHWKGKDECGECGFHEKDYRDLSHYNYCPNCGVMMIDGEAGEDESC